MDICLFEDKIRKVPIFNILNTVYAKKYNPIMWTKISFYIPFRKLTLKRAVILLCIILFLYTASQFYNIRITDKPILFRWLYFNTYSLNLAENHIKEETIWVKNKRSQKIFSIIDCNSKFKANKNLMKLFLKESDIIGLSLKSETEIYHNLITNGVIVENGGLFKPKNCRSREAVAVLVPYRQREDNLLDFIHYMHKFLQTQLRYYRIYILQQGNDLLFNRAKLFNAGVREIWKRSAQGDFKPDCFILHDVDKLPQNLNNIYECSESPKQLLVEYFENKGLIKEWKSYYSYFFGGITAFTKWQILRFNGASNDFYGWGGEDDDLYGRVLIAGMNPEFASEGIGRYWVRNHRNDMHKIKERYIMLSYHHILYRMKDNGIHQVNYILKSYTTLPLYTKLVLDV